MKGGVKNCRAMNTTDLPHGPSSPLGRAFISQGLIIFSAPDWLDFGRRKRAKDLSHFYLCDLEKNTDWPSKSPFPHL